MRIVVCHSLFCFHWCPMIENITFMGHKENSCVFFAFRDLSHQSKSSCMLMKMMRDWSSALHLSGSLETMMRPGRRQIELGIEMVHKKQVLEPLSQKVADIR